MNIRPLSPFEAGNVAALNAAGLRSALLFATQTALRKSILDATETIRALFQKSGFHTYTEQLQGPEHKRIALASALVSSGIHRTRVSLYRPRTKEGDPRFWISDLNSLADPGDAIAIFFVRGEFHFANISRTSIADAPADSAIGAFLEPLRAAGSQIADELLSHLRSLAAGGPLRAVCSGDTAVGRTVESALGIDINSSRAPDYRGIELKAARSAISRSPTRATLFACVPDWHLSHLKSSAAILERFGYRRDGRLKLYCSVTSQKTNSQRLRLSIDESLRWLCELSALDPTVNVAVWRLEKLEDRLSSKHRETFWIAADSERRSDGEWFHLRSVTHTRDPNTTQLERLLADGGVTLDHLIKETDDGRIQEKGPLFKIHRKRIPELFLGVPRFHSLET